VILRVLLNNKKDVPVKRVIFVFIAAVFIFSAAPVYAQYSSGAYGGTKDETVFTRMGDWFATIGKTQEEKYLIKSRRRAVRKIRKANKLIEQRKREIARRRKGYR